MRDRVDVNKNAESEEQKCREERPVLYRSYRHHRGAHTVLLRHHEVLPLDTTLDTTRLQVAHVQTVTCGQHRIPCRDPQLSSLRGTIIGEHRTKPDAHSSLRRHAAERAAQRRPHLNERLF